MGQIKAYLKVFSDYSGLLRELVNRDLKVKYRGSVLGLLWSILNPLLTMLVMTVVFSTIFKNEIPNFPIYYLSGVIVFTLNNEATTDGMYSIIYNAPLLKKIYVPKYLFPIAKVFMAMINAVFSSIAMFFIMLLTGAPFHITLLLLPLSLIYVSIFACGLALFLAAVAVRFRDLCYFYNVLVYAWTFLTPLFYPITSLPPIAQKLMNFNPMFHYVNFNRNVVLYGQWPSFNLHMFCLIFAVAMFIIGLFTFYKLQNTFIYHI